jgi:regulator-associated protein of mTOR
MTGCDDGSIRLWGGILDDFEEIPYKKPILCTGFFAMPELNPGKRGSGLVTEWQQSHGRLIVGGNCPRIRCWDLEAEKCRSIIDSDMSVCLTSITTTWDSFLLSTQNRVDGSSGLGPDIIVAGYGDGTICAYDLRIPNAGAVSENKSDPRSRLRERWMKQARFTEHSNWIVNTSFRPAGSRYEVSSMRGLWYPFK